MKTQRENVIRFKNYLKKRITKRKQLKLLANKSSKDKDYNWNNTRRAKSELEETLEDIHALYIAYYIVKHNLIEQEKELDYIIECSKTYKKHYTYYTTKQCFLSQYGYVNKKINEYLNKFGYESEFIK